VLPISFAEGATLTDTVDPTVSITSPASGGSMYDTNQSTITLEGTVSDDNATKQIVWANDQGGAGFTDASTNWSGQYDWQANSIPLVEGTNTITVTAQDAVGNEGSDFLVVNRTVSPPVPPPDDVRGIVLNRSKVKMDIFYDSPPDADDHASIVSFLEINPGENFIKTLMDLDVTVKLEIRDPNPPNQLIPIFTQTIDAFTIDSSKYSKYRFTTGPSGIRDLTIAKNTSTTHYMYLSIDTVDFLPQIRESIRATGVFPGDYADWLLGVDTLILTLQGGDVIAWEGEIPLTANGTFINREEFTFNR